MLTAKCRVLGVGCCGQGGRGEHTWPGWRHWSAPFGSRFAVTRWIVTPLPWTPPLRYREKINPGFFFQDSASYTWQEWERLTCKWVRAEWGAAAGPAQGSGVCQPLQGAALRRVWKCLGEKIYCRNTKFPLMRRVGNRVIMWNPFVLFHPVHWHSTGDSLNVHQKQTCQSTPRVLIGTEQPSLLITVSMNSNQNPLETIGIIGG